MRQRWLSTRALLLHVALLIWSPGCLIAGWWQVHRALSGNTLSYLYSIEWPCFALAGVYAWWLLVHIDSSTPGRTTAEQLLAARRSATHAAAARRSAPAARDGGTIGELLVAQRAAAANATADAAGTSAPGGPGALAPVSLPARRPSRRTVTTSGRTARRERGVDERLAAYNERLARLATQGPETWRRR